jgi:CBS domain-containing protein
MTSEGTTMQAKDLMTTSVITVAPDTQVREAAQIMLRHRISAVPVVDSAGKLVGIVSEGDLLHRAEAGTERRRSWWLDLIASPESRAYDYVKSHAVHVRDVMSTNTITVSPETSISEIAEILEERRIKRVPVTSAGRVVGIVSRADLLHGVATSKVDGTAPGDSAIREAVMTRMHNETGVRDWLMNVTVANGVVHLWGIVSTEIERKAVRVAAETVNGVKDVEDHLTMVKEYGGE